IPPRAVTRLVPPRRAMTLAPRCLCGSSLELPESPHLVILDGLTLMPVPRRCHGGLPREFWSPRVQPPIGDRDRTLRLIPATVEGAGAQPHRRPASALPGQAGPAPVPAHHSSLVRNP